MIYMFSARCSTGSNRCQGPAVPLIATPLSMDNLELICSAGLIKYVDLKAMGVKMKRFTPRVPDTWAWADRLKA